MNRGKEEENKKKLGLKVLKIKNKFRHEKEKKKVVPVLGLRHVLLLEPCIWFK